MILSEKNKELPEDLSSAASELSLNPEELNQKDVPEPCLDQPIE